MGEDQGIAVLTTPRSEAELRSGAAADRVRAASLPLGCSSARPLRVAVIRQRWRPDGGGERQAQAFLEFFSKQACQATLLTLAWDAAAGQEHEIVCCKPWAVGRAWREWSFARRVQKVLARRRFDLVQSHERIPGCDVYRAGDGVHRQWLRHKARVQSPWGRWLTAVHPYHLYVKRAERRMFESPRLRAVICNSQLARDDILRWFNVDPAKLHVIYNGVDTERLHPRLRRRRGEVRRRLGVPEHAPLFLFVGSAFRHKGLGVALEAVAQTPDGYLAVVGKAERAGPFLRQARRLGIGDRVRLAGVQADVGPFYGAADALVLPSLYDLFPNVVLEAMAAGLPVAVSTTCGAAELIVEGQNGFVRDALDRAGFAHALRELSNSHRRQAMSRAARAAAEPLNLEATRRRLIAFYRSLLDDRLP